MKKKVEIKEIKKKIFFFINKKRIFTKIKLCSYLNWFN